MMGQLHFKYKQKKNKLSCIGSWDGTVKILNNEYNIIEKSPGGDYAVTSLSTDDNGEYLFFSYKGETIKVKNKEKIEQENENDAKQLLETRAEINAILFESKFFKVYTLGTKKGLQIRKIKGGKEPEFEDNENGACLSLTYDKGKEYLLA